MKGHAGLWGLFFATSQLAACNSGVPCDAPLGCGAAVINEAFSAAPNKDVDLLFLMDNSPSMSARQAALAHAMPRFIQKIEDTGASYHLGIATSDVGTYVAPGKAWSISLGACNSFEGDDGALQREACNTRSGITSSALQACQSLCPDPKFVPQDGQGFISKVNGVTNVPREIMAGKDVGPQRAFQCLAIVGDAGCGVEGQLEGAKRALDGHNPQNAGFLRPGSLLGVIFLTDEDDCSVQLGRRGENDPVTMNCPTPDRDAPGACFNTDFRCMARDVICDEPLNTEGPKTNCRERPDSYLEPVESYVRFFRALRPASRLLLSGLWTLPRLDGGGKLVVRQRMGATRSEGLNRGEGRDAACVKANDANFFGRPQHRLSKLARALPGSLEFSQCDSDRYPEALDEIARAIQGKLASRCLSAVPRVAAGRPLCLVGDVDAATPLSPAPEPMPLCGGGCCAAWTAAATPRPEDPAIRDACAAEAAEACYCAGPSSAGACPGGAVLGIWRKGGAPGPDGKVINAQCAVAGP